MKLRILFVDDEIRVLQGLKRMLHNMSHEWDMAFSDSGQAALDLMETRKFDVIVTDMRMPGMDGGELLAQVIKRHPNMVRIILSGHSDQTMILKSVKAAHQFLTKPCEADILKSTIVQAYKLQDLLRNEDVKQVVSKVESLPSLPSVYSEIVKEMESPEPSIKKVGDIIEKDIGMAAKMLQLVNSAFFGLPRHVASPSHAVSLLGIDVVKSLVLSIHVFSAFNQSQVYHFSLNKLWQHSVLVSRFAKRILEIEKLEPSLVDYGFLAGIVHDIGMLVLAANLPDKYELVMRLATEGKLPIHQAEMQVFSTNHSEVGAYLLGLWGLPGPIIETVAFHHQIDECRTDQMSPLIAVYYANYADYQLNPDHCTGGALKLDRVTLNKCQCKHSFDVWYEHCHRLSQLAKGAESGK